MCIRYSHTPPLVFISKLNRFLEENKPPGFQVLRRWEMGSEPPQPKCRQREPSGLSSVAPKGYKGLEFPILGGENSCEHCKCTPCVIQQPPDFLVGSGVPHLRNKQRRYSLYRRFWSLMDAIGLWRHPEYLAKKEERTVRDDPREIMPSCIVKV